MKNIKIVTNQQKTYQELSAWFENEQNQASLHNEYQVRSQPDDDVRYALTNLTVEGKTFDTFIIMLDDFLRVSQEEDLEVLNAIAKGCKAPDLNITAIISKFNYNTYKHKLKETGITNLYMSEADEFDPELFAEILENKFTAVKQWQSFYDGNELEFFDKSLDNDNSNIFDDGSYQYKAKIDDSEIEEGEEIDINDLLAGAPIKGNNQETKEDFKEVDIDAMLQKEEVNEPESIKETAVEKPKTKTDVNDMFSDTSKKESNTMPEQNAKSNGGKKNRSKKNKNKNNVNINNNNSNISNANNKPKNNNSITSVKKEPAHINKTNVPKQNIKSHVELHVYQNHNCSSTEIIAEILKAKKINGKSIFVFLDSDNISTNGINSLDMISKMYEMTKGDAFAQTVFDAVSGGGIGFDSFARLEGAQGEVQNINAIISSLKSKYNNVHIIGSLENVYNVNTQDASILYSKEHLYNDLVSNLEAISKHMNQYSTNQLKVTLI